jgi:tRNA A-37 threonylcarbamoyl transferase component Bud32
VSPATSQLGMCSLFAIHIRLSVWKLVCSLHEHDIQHNDVVPRNFIRDHDGRIRVVDFEMSELDHVCKGTKECEELNRLWEDLDIQGFN